MGPCLCGDPLCGRCFPGAAEWEAARDELDRVLAEAGWTYYRAMVRYAWQMNWNKNREAVPPAVETLSEEQVRHLSALTRTNQLRR
jgi:hypothetical protein